MFLVVTHCGERKVLSIPSQCFHGFYFPWQRTLGPNLIHV